MIIKNGVGLEAEFMVLKNGKLDYPSKYGFSTDEYIILGEFRAEPGFTVEETVGNFFSAVTWVARQAERRKVVARFTRSMKISAEFKSEILRKMGGKEIPMCKNIYGKDILNHSDDVVQGGKITHSYVSAGLHIHFSRMAVHEYKDEKGNPQVAKVNLITPSMRERIIKALDKEMFPKYNRVGENLGMGWFEPKLKYRQKGFYEVKPHGFEYRSLPFVDDMLQFNNITKLVGFCFEQLEKLGE